ncbi:MAG TPA: NAD(P)-binding domain-containing protein [Terracidiphilus sp.]|nr:NAD(P)-binding domain-containing protein [Terracidiphilus sp.]
MKVGVLGSGDVAKTLASGFLKHGHQVRIGSRSPAKLAEWSAGNPGSTTGTFAEAAQFGEIVVLAVKGNVAAEALKLAGAQNLAGKTVIDACNPIEDAPPSDGVLRFFTDLNDSLMERLQRQFGEAHFVKAFNSVGAPCMINPQFAGGRPTMFICGNNEAAKKQVAKINEEFGWETADMGSAGAARAIEPLCMLWCIPGFTRNDWTHAFKLLTK